MQPDSAPSGSSDQGPTAAAAGAVFALYDLDASGALDAEELGIAVARARLMPGRVAGSAPDPLVGVPAVRPRVARLPAPALPHARTLAAGA